MRNRFYVESEFYCTACGSRGIPIQRRIGAEREAGHLKKIFCLKCQRETNHVECKPYTKYSHKDFLLEFNEHNFTKEGQRILSYGQLRDKLNKEGRLHSCLKS
jgi:hypothetical protein